MYNTSRFFTASIKFSPSIAIMLASRMGAVINIYGTRDLHNERSAARRCAALCSAARHFAALITLFSNFICDAAWRCFLCECCHWLQRTRLEQRRAALRGTAHSVNAVLP